MKRLAAGLLCLVPMVSVLACSYSYVFEYDVTIAPSVDTSGELGGARVLMVAGSGESSIEETAVDGDVAFDPATSSYSGEGRTCCSPGESMSLYAFIDLNGNELWDAGEPWGEDPNNPVDIDDDGYVAKIVIEADE